MLNKSIAYRLSIYISLAVIGVFIAFIAIYFLFNQRFIKENVQNKAITLTNEVKFNVDVLVVTTQEITSNLSEQIAFYGNQDHADDFIKSLMKKYPFINGIEINLDPNMTDLDYFSYYCYRQNDSIKLYKSVNPIVNCINQQEYVKTIVKNNEAGWSEPVRCSRNGYVVAPYFSPIHSDIDGVETMIGSVICELSLLDLNNTVNKIKIGERGFAFLVSRTGIYITHPSEDRILNKNIFDLTNSSFKIKPDGISKFLDEAGSGSAIAHPEILDKEKCWVYYTKISSNGWSLIMVMPYKELYQPLFLPVLQMLFFSVLGILIVYLLVTYIIDKQIQPLSLVTQQLKKFSRLAGDLDEIPENEIIQVSQSLNSIKMWYEKYRQSQLLEEKKSERRERDLSQASEIQRSFIKTEFPAFPDRKEIDIYAVYKPLIGVSGDLFDFFFIDDEHLVFTIGDVSGKGLPAAFYMSVAQTVIKSSCIVNSAREIVNRSNEVLYTNNQHLFFLTMFLGILNVKTGKLNYCNAAHIAPYVLKRNGELYQLSQTHGLPLGLYQDKKYNESYDQLEKGDLIFLYTDGVTELNNEDRVQYGHERLEKNLSLLAGRSSKEVVDKIDKSLQLYMGNSTQSDDISMLVLAYYG